ncbi:MAG TPA: hypothetical protein VNL77_06215, partial [Roseiflexaceae bacterium]|nr:hypothetical protein [Roseiflexaceae bacterium]
SYQVPVDALAGGAAAQLQTNDDLPRVDEQWLHRVCKAREVYRERHKGGFRPEWQLVPGLGGLVKEAERRLDANTRVALSEVAIAFIPVTELVFDLGDVQPGLPPGQQAAPGRGRPRRAEDSGLYRWYIYGFEKRLPKDWRFLNWDRVTAVALGVALLAALLLLALLVTLR